uniref:Disease resistance protein At4g27190-like leucine-rich repeats domain-containing protein n=3 Tax=Aegilops tauschii subsp. strangulata TaxID=200361 RepID=A0A453DNY2_AEGTS
LLQRLGRKDVDGATETINLLLGNFKVIYFDGWNGFGASSVLRSIAAMLPSRRTPPEQVFDKKILIDCSKWKNKRGVQRAIAKELQLDRSIMAILDEQDEDDDFWGRDESSRCEIDSVSQVIDRTLRDIKLMMIFLNGSDDEVDVGPMGIPLPRYGDNRVIWTFSGSYMSMHHNQSKVASKLRSTEFFFYCSIEELTSSQFRGLLHQQAGSIVARNPCRLDIDQTIIADCCLYELFLHYNFHTVTKFDWVSHASNYWICDGIIQWERARDISNALHLEINWKCDASLLDHVLKMFMEHSESPFLAIKDDDLYEEGPYRWISVTSRDAEVHGMKAIPAEASSFFLAFEISNPPRALPGEFFDYCSKLGVLTLYCCAFNFASPSFLKCHGLRFLGLDHCTDDKTIGGENHAVWLCLSSLWVLDLRYTDWNEILSKEMLNLMKNIRELNIEGVRGWQYTTDLQGRLPNLQRLRIIKPTCQWETSEDVDNSSTDKKSMEILDLSGNCDMKILPPSLWKATSLRLLVLDGCDGLESIGRLPPSLESFSFNGYGPASQWTETAELPSKQFRPSSRTDNKDVRISKISLAGCTQLENLYLCGLPNLVELDLSGTSIKILDFETMVVQIPRLKRLFLIGCKHLRAITFSHESVPDLELLCVDTRAGIVCPLRPSISKNKPTRLQVHGVVVDARLTHSLSNLIFNYRQGGVHFNIHVTSSPMYDGIIQFEATNKDMIGPSDQESLQLIPTGRYSDVLGMVGVVPMQAFPQPPTTKFDRHVEIADGSFYVERELGEALGQLMGNHAESLHVHDILVRAIMPKYSSWVLRWCCVERCPKVDTVFPGNSFEFTALETFWVSDLMMARSILSKGSRFNGYGEIGSFKSLQHLQLRSCPSLQFVLPVWVSSFPSLVTLHIIHCGNLSHVFVLDEEYPEEITTLGVLFPKLTTIDLHDLPKLENICEVKMVAPALESIKIRGCWSLRRLPSVGAHGNGKKKPAIEIEKDVWDALEWDARHRPVHFEAPVHSRYYKEKLPRVSVLR